MSTSIANRKPRKLPILAALLLGGLSGLGLYTYAEGAAYFSDDPKACLNCHVMREPFEANCRASPQHRFKRCKSF